MTNPVAKARQNEARRKRKKLAAVKSAQWMRNFEGYTGHRGVYQDARSAWWFRSRQPSKGVKRSRVYYETLADALSEVNSRSEYDHNMKLYEIERERNL